MNQPDTHTITLSWQPELIDFREAFRARNKARKVWRKILTMSGIALAIGIAALIIGGLFSVVFSKAVSVALNGFTSALTFICFLFALMLPIMVPILQPLSVRALWRRNPALHSMMTATVDPESGITVANVSQTTHPWPSVHGFIETPRSFVIQLSGYHNLPFFLLGKRGLSSPEQIVELRTLLATHSQQL